MESSFEKIMLKQKGPKRALSPYPGSGVGGRGAHIALAMIASAAPYPPSRADCPHSFKPAPLEPAGCERAIDKGLHEVAQPHTVRRRPVVSIAAPA